MYAIAHGGCTDTVRESAPNVDWENYPLLHRGSNLSLLLLTSLLCPAMSRGREGLVPTHTLTLTWCPPLRCTDARAVFSFVAVYGLFLVVLDRK